MTGSPPARGLAARVEGLEPEVVARLVGSWEQTQQRYATARAARSEAIVASIDEVVGRRGPDQQGASSAVVLEIGCGPGTFTRELSVRFPNVEVVGLDADPVLLALGRAAAGGQVRLVETHVGQPGWRQDLGAVGPVLAVVASAVLHYPPVDELKTIYHQLFTLLPPGGLLVNADEFGDDQPEVLRLRRRVATSARPAAASLDWAGWWAELNASLVAADADEQLVVEPRLGGDNGLSTADHEAVLRSVGFSQVGVVWRLGPSGVLVAVR